MKFNTMEQVYDYLKVNGLKIGELAKKGNKLARQIIGLYDMHHKCPGDPGAQGLLMASLEEYIEDREGIGLTQ